MVGISAVDLLTVDDVMVRLPNGRHTVCHLIRTRQLRAVRIGRCRRIPATVLTAYLDTLAGACRT